MRLFAKQRQQSLRQEARGKQEERWRRGSKELGRASTSSGRHTLGTRACCVQQREGTWLGGNQVVWDRQFGQFGQFGQLDWDVGCWGVPIGGRSSRQQQVGPPQLCTLSALCPLPSALCPLPSALCPLHSAFSAASLPLSPCQHHVDWADTTISAFKRRPRAQVGMGSRLDYGSHASLLPQAPMARRQARPPPTPAKNVSLASSSSYNGTSSPRPGQVHPETTPSSRHPSRSHCSPWPCPNAM
jgi:hypothetical protein